MNKSFTKPLDGVNLLPYLTGTKQGRPHETLFWKSGSRWAVRHGDLKLVAGNTDEPRKKQGRKKKGRLKQTAKGSAAEVMTKKTNPLLFNVAEDPAETTDLATEQPETVARLQMLYEAWKEDFPATPW